MVVVMIVMAAFTIVIVVMMLVFMFFLIFMVVVMIVMAALTIVIVVMMLVLMIMLSLLFQFCHQLCFQIGCTLDGCKNVLAIQFIPGSGNDGRLGIMLTNELHGLFQLVLRNITGSA